MALHQNLISNAALLRLKFGAAPFPHQDAIACGLSKNQLHTLVAAGHVARLHQNAYVVVDQFSEVADLSRRHEIECRAVAASSPNAVISHESAALLHGLPIGRTFHRAVPGDRVQLTIPGQRRAKRTGHDVSGCLLPDSDVVTIDGLPVTSVARTAIDIARRQRLPDGLMAIDAASRLLVAELMDPGMDLRFAVHDEQLRREARHQLAAVCKPMAGWAGIGHARQGVKLSEPAMEGALETQSRWQIIQFDLPMPKFGWPLHGASGLRYWVDAWWEQFALIGEADGKLKYTDPDRLYAEKLREDDLRRRYPKFVRWPWHEVVPDPTPFIDKLRAAFTM